MYAIPAKKGIRTFTQADGTTVEVELVGDEFAHMYVTPDGYPLVEKAGSLYYAGISADGTVEACDLKATSLRSRSAAANDFLRSVDKNLVSKALQAKAAAWLHKRSAASTGMMRAPQGPGLSPDSNFPVTGSPHVLVILAEFSNVPMTLDNANDYFTRMMTERGFSDYNGTGSAIDYFDENSSGQFTPIIDVYGPVKLPNTRAYYGGNDSNGSDKNPAHMIVDACEALDDEVDFTKYDNDGDGVVDNVFVFYAGRGEADGGPSESVWPHSWYASYGGINKSFDGVKIDRYACSNEYGDKQPDGVGTFIHEFSHVMGLPDLYATSYSNAFTPGEWSALDYGPYNNNGRTPPLYSAFERYALGWLEPVVIDGPMSAVLRPIGDNVCGIIKTGNDNEYFLVENRQQTSWDKYIPGHGMLVWHIDYNKYAWNSNTVNNSVSHQYVDIEEADGTKNSFTRAGDAFPGTSHVTSFTDDTTPSMKTWAGKGLGLPITNISEDNKGVIFFDVAGGGNGNASVNTPTALAATDVESTGFTANWQADEGTDYLLTVYKKDADGRAVYTKYYRTNVGAVSSAKVDGLEISTTYYYTVSAISGFNMSEASNEIAVTTLRPGIESFAIEALPASSLSENGFTANWESLPEATNYLLSVYELTPGDPIDFTTGFDDSTLPPDWSSSGFTLIRLAKFCGKALPSISLTGGNYIETADYGNIYTLSFWHCALMNSTGTIEISAKIGGKWSVCKEFELTTTKGITNEMELPDGTSAVRIKFSGKGNLQIDDVALNYVNDIARTAVAPYENYDVGNVTSYNVTGLTPGKSYSYFVQGSDGVKESKVSAEVRVKTPEVSGIIAVGAVDNLKVSTADGVLGVSGISDETAVTVYDIAGRIVGTGLGECSFGLVRGVYIVRAGSASVKVRF